MKERRKTKRSIKTMEENLKRLEQIINSKNVRPVDYVTRDRIARQLREAQKMRA